MKTDIFKKAGNTMAKVVAKGKKHSPEILIVAGIAGTVVSAVLACKATLKVGEIHQKAKDDVDRIHEAAENGVTEAGEVYTAEDQKKDLTIAYVQTGLQYVKLYAPAIILGGLSITSILASNNILRKRNVALAAAYTAVDKSFKEYRGRVVERFGDKVDQELRYGIKAKKIEETEVDPETGKEKKVKKTVEVADPNLKSDFACYFDRTSRNYETNRDFNMMFLRAQQNYANDILRARGHLFLNEVYDMLDLPRTTAGQIVGWTYNPEAPESDGYVDFRILEIVKENEDSTYEPAIIIDPNVDGDILSKI